MKFKKFKLEGKLPDMSGCSNKQICYNINVLIAENTSRRPEQNFKSWQTDESKCLRATRRTSGNISLCATSPWLVTLYECNLLPECQIKIVSMDFIMKSQRT